MVPYVVSESRGTWWQKEGWLFICCKQCQRASNTI